MSALNLNAASTATKAGLGKDAVRDILRGKSLNPSNDTLQRIAKILGCSVADLTGERSRPAPLVHKHQTDTVEIIELEVHANAGMGADADSAIMAYQEAGAILGVHSMPAASFREAYGISPGRVRVIPVKGNSMEPRLWPGQRVMVDVEDKIPSPPGIFVVWDGLGLVLKYVEVIPNSDPLTVRISSANPAFLSYERTVDEAHINGRVIGLWARL